MNIFFDGGCRPNPGSIDVAVVFGGAAHVRCGIATGDNSAAEWLALLWALDLAVAAKVQDALFIGDSALVIAQAGGRQPCRSAHLQGYCAAFRLGAEAIPRLRLKHVPRAKNLAGIVLAQRDR